MIFFLLLVAAIKSSSTAPVPSAPLDHDDPGILLTILGRELPECVNPARYRTLQEIIISCLATTFACTWVALHPNVPDPRYCQWHTLKRKVAMMACAIIAPEFVTIWAFRQWIGAAYHRDMYNETFLDMAPPQPILSILKGGYRIIGRGDYAHEYIERLSSPRVILSIIEGWFHSVWQWFQYFVLRTRTRPERLEKSWFCDGATINEGGESVEGWEQVGTQHEQQKKTPNVVWTLTHGFLLEMGGLVGHDKKGDRVLITDVEQLDAPFDISDTDISDRSKGDALTKLIVTLQTSWFMFQCLFRWISHLPVTELEVVTLAFAFLTIITYSLWWNKPQNMTMATSWGAHVDIKLSGDQLSRASIRELELELQVVQRAIKGEDLNQMLVHHSEDRRVWDQWLQECLNRVIFLGVLTTDSAQVKLPDLPAELQKHHGLQEMVLRELREREQELQEREQELRELQQELRVLREVRERQRELRDRDREGSVRVREGLVRKLQELREQELRELREQEQWLKVLKQQFPELRGQILQRLIVHNTGRGLPKKFKIEKWEGRKQSLEEELKRRRAGTQEQSRSSHLLDLALDIVFRRFRIFRPLVPFVEMLGYSLHKTELHPQRDMFYSSTENIDEPQTLIPISLVGIAFGGIHLIPIWLSTFPSPQEKLAWTISAIWITAEPVVLALLKPTLDICKGLEVLRIMLITVGGVTGVMCIVARLAILVLVFTTLRKLPDETFFNIEWSTFFPHV